MASAIDTISSHSPFGAPDPLGTSIHNRSIPILSTSTSAKSSTGSSVSSSRTMAPSAVATAEPMDITPTSSMGPPALSSPMAERDNPLGNQTQQTNGESKTASPTSNGTTSNAPAPAIGAAAAASQPKVVQTAFIHKLYNMLEDQNIQHLISWSHTNESFVMSPSTEFSKVLSSYFKHTNISSFVRQLNMYGFHKVSDVFHNGQPDSPLWEFKHGNGSFKRGDLVGLREIKRRASKHALIHRDSFSGASGAAGTPKNSIVGPTLEVPGGVAGGMEALPQHSSSLEARLSVIEHNYFDVHARLARSEDQTSFLAGRCAALAEGLLRCHQWNQDLSHYLMAMISDQDSQIHKDVAMMQREIARQADLLRSYDEPPAPPPAPRDNYFSSINDNGPPLSPRQMPAPDRRPSQPSLLSDSRPSFRLPIAPHLAVSPRRYGSIGSNNNAYSPSSARLPQPPSSSSTHLPPPPPPQQHPLATVASPPTNLPRRHTSADIRLHGWNGGPPNLSPNGTGAPSHHHNNNSSPYHSGHNSSSAWPSSPHRTPLGASGLSNSHSALGEAHQIREALASYELPRKPRSRQESPSPGGGSLHKTSSGDSGSGSGTTLPSLAASALSNNGPGGGNLAPESAWQLPGARFSSLAGGTGSPFGSVGGPRASLRNGGGMETPPGPLTRRSSMASNVHSLLNPPAEEGEPGAGDEMDVDGERKRKRVV